MIIGEALLRIERTVPDALQGLPDYRHIIGFRNVIAHNYGDVNLGIMWDAIGNGLPVLRGAVSDRIRRLESDAEEQR